MIEATVDSIRVSLMTQNRVVILKEREGNRHLPIWIGAYEAEAIALQLQDIVATRPLPYDLMKSLLDELDGTLDHVVIAELADQVFYATLSVKSGDRTIEIDARPSDALALAVRTNARILVEDSVMDHAGITLTAENSTIVGSRRDEHSAAEQEFTGSADTTITPADADELGVFRDFINTLDMDDFGQGKKSNDKS